MSPDDFDANSRRAFALKAEDDGEDALDNAKCGVYAMLKAFAQDRTFTMQDDVLLRYLHTLEQDLERAKRAHQTLCDFVTRTLPSTQESMAMQSVGRPDAQIPL